MACSGPYKGYLSYNCYKDIKHQFGEKIKGPSYEIRDKIVEFEKEYPPDKRTKLNELSEVFINLKKYLSNDHVFASSDYNKEATCNYINYLLYYGIRKNKNGDTDETTFNYFKDFVNKYNVKTKSTMCLHKLERLDFNVFRKWEALYDLYDKYIELLPVNSRTYYNYCNTMHRLFYLYNNFLNEYRSDSPEFDDVLTKFEELMNTITNNAKSNCVGEHFPMGKPHLFKKTVEEIHPPPKTSSEPEGRLSNGATLDNARNPVHQEVPTSTTALVGKQERAYQEISQGSEVSELTKVAATFVSPEPVERRQLHEGLEHSEKHVSFKPQQYYVSPGTYGHGSYYEQVGHLETNEKFPPRGDSFVVTEPLERESEKENVGVMTNIQNALSGFMNGVDPVPVVGVSGGMGALFLLFRYTPIGTFFRGGRRINNRIPSRFSGHFPGGFTGYEEFYDGGFGNGPINISYRPELE